MNAANREGNSMNKPDWLQSSISIGNIVTIVPIIAVIMAGSVGYGQLQNKIDNIEAFRVERTKTTDEKFANITRILESLPSLTYRMTAQEEALKATNQRVDQSLANISARLAEINQGIGAIDTKVAVLAQRFESERADRRKALLLPGPFKHPAEVFKAVVE